MSTVLYLTSVLTLIAMAVFMINICKYNGCGITFPRLNDLIEHIEDVHIGKCSEIICIFKQYFLFCICNVIHDPPNLRLINVPMLSPLEGIFASIIKL